MKTKTVKATLSVFVAFSLALSSCDKKNVSLVNRRTATPERMKEINEKKEAEKDQAAAQARVVATKTQEDASDISSRKHTW
ncbi:hypothetical protein AGMMS49531_05150 [Endomicrobiia bacterium]|nr:hypothetical protein AGMMS49531_05150 [Endomicrobiia bacterium]